MNSEKNGPERLESDATKIVRKHLQDENHVITEEEMRSIRVGSTPAPTGSEAAKLEEFNHEIEEAHKNDEDLSGDAEGPVTPWDTIKP